MSDKKLKLMVQDVRAELTAELREIIKEEMRESIRTEMRQAIKEEFTAVIKEEMRTSFKEELHEELAPIRTQLTDLLSIKQTVKELEEGATFASKRVDDLYRVTLPSITAHMEKLATQLAMQTLDIDMHRRKWNIMVHGVSGAENEDEGVTRSKCVKLAQEHMQLPEASAADFGACHRLSREKDSGIILRFLDLNKRDWWIRNAKHLRNHETRISVSPDVPPVLRPLRKELLQKRSGLPDDQKRQSGIRYRPKWPYLELSIRDRPTVKHNFSQEDIVNKVLDTDLKLVINEPSQ